jgi:IS30 family transposase
MTSQIELKQTAKQYEIEDRRKQISIMIAQGMTEIAIAKKLGVDNSTISKDIKAMKLASEQFAYDMAKSDYTYYYLQNLDVVRLVLRKQCELVDKEQLTSQDVIRAKILSDILSTVSTINEYYDASKHLHKDPMLKVLQEEYMGPRPESTSTRRPKFTRDETLEMLQEEEEDTLKLMEDLKKHNEVEEYEEMQECLNEIREKITSIRNNPKFKGAHKPQ